MSGKTVTKVKYERIHEEPLPGVTICIPISFSMEKAANYDPYTAQLYRNYKDTLGDNKTGIDEQLFMIYVEMLKYLMGQFQYIGARDFLVNYSITWSELNRMSTIVTSISGQAQIANAELDLEEGLYYYIGEPIASIVQMTNNWFYQCFTLFSSLRKAWKEYKMFLDQIYMTLTFSEPILIKSDRIFVAIHPPNDLPSLNNNVFNMEMSNEFMIEYYRIEMTLLGKGYDTNCKNYGKDNDTNVSTRSDCISNCMHEKIFQIDECVNYFEPKFTLFRAEKILNNKEDIISPCNLSEKHSRFMKRLKLECSNIWQKDCNTLFFNLNSHSNKVNSERTISFRINHGGTPDIILTYLPETTFLSLVCNFGGLLGMWMGMSILSISEQLIIIFQKHVYNYYRFLSNYFITNYSFNFKQQIFVNSKRPIST